VVAGETSDLQELVKRRVPQIVLITIAAGWLLLQGMDQLVDRGVLGNLAYRLTLPFVGAAVLASTVIAWFHGQKGKQRAPVVEYVLLAVTAALWAGVTAWIILGS